MDSLKRLFSPLLEETVAGLDIGEDYISAASVFFKGGGNIKIEKMGFVSLEPGLSNRLKATAIRKLWRENNIKTRTVSSCLRTPSLTLKHFKYPRLSGHEFESAIQLEAEQIFQRPKEDLYIDWQLYSGVPATGAKASAETEGILVTVPKEEVVNHLSLLSMAGLYPIVLDVGCMAVSNLFLKLRGAGLKETICLVNANSYAVDISIFCETFRIYPRFVYSKDISFLKRMEYLTENIDDLLRYYQFKLRLKPVDRVIFTGRLSAEENFQKKMNSALRLPVEFWDPSSGLASQGIKHNYKNDIAGPVSAASIALAMRKE